jgi:hypothetical protein
MGDGRIFLKTVHDVFFNKVLSNEPNFGRIHLAGQYLKDFKPIPWQVQVYEQCTNMSHWLNTCVKELVLM